MLDKLYVTRQTARFRAIDTLALPEYKGSTFRGALGHSFRRVSCPIICRDNKTCLLRYRCAYSVCFETPIPDSATIMRLYPFAPHPFVIEPPKDSRTQLERGEEFELQLILIGRGNDYFAHFIYAFDELGKAGLGRGRGKAELVSLTAPTGDGAKVLYNKSEELVLGSAPIVRSEAIARRCGELKDKPIRLTFETPTRIKRHERFTSEPTLENLVPSLLRRLHSLEYFHCGGAEEWDVAYLLSMARGVCMRRHETTWRDIERYSQRQDRHMQLGGFVGYAEFDPLPEPLLPYLAWGEVVHLGKASAFGFGKYRIEDIT